MTSLVSWVGVDQRGPSSIYIATDSRVSWETHQSVWDFGRKVFASRTRPEVLAYVGDVLFPSLILGQIVDIIDDGRAIGNEGTPENRFEWIKSVVRESFEQFPSHAQNSFRIAYATRTGEKMGSEFHFFWLKWDGEWSSGQYEIPITSDTVAVWGTGRNSICRWKQRWDSSIQRQTSRAIFSALCDSLDHGYDPRSGGAPQLVGIYRIDIARTIGIIHQGRPYIFGLPVTPSEHSAGTIEWRNRLFERCNHQGERLQAAQEHYASKGLGGIRK